MKLSPVSITNFSKMSFKGHEEAYSYSKGVDSLKDSSYWHKNSSVDKTLGSYHLNQTGKAYYADPLEPISDAIRDRVDYIIYDNEPSYPKLRDIEKNYLGNNRTNYRDDFEEVRNYYYRREMGGFANIDEAKYQQWQAAECTGLYDRAGNARYRKETLEDEVANIDKDIKSKEQEINDAKKSIKEANAKKVLLMKEQKNYTLKNEKYSKLEDLSAKSIKEDNAEMLFIKSQISKLKNKISNCQKEIQELVTKIATNQKTVEAKNEEILVLKGQKTYKNSQILEIIERELKPMFKNLQDFYLKQGIKIIK